MAVEKCKVCNTLKKTYTAISAGSDEAGLAEKWNKNIPQL